MIAELPTQAEIDAFKAPDVLVGQDVVFYPMAHVNSRRPSLGKVIWIGQNQRIVNILETDQHGKTLVREAVRHIDDPKLKLNEDQRENGAWDFTPYAKAETAKWEDMCRHLRALEGCLLGPTKSDRELLYYYGEKFGIEAYSTKKSDELRVEVLECLYPPKKGKSKTDDAKTE
jgi:hypothetical protein